MSSSSEGGTLPDGRNMVYASVNVSQLPFSMSERNIEHCSNLGPLGSGEQYGLTLTIFIFCRLGTVPRSFGWSNAEQKKAVSYLQKQNQQDVVYNGPI